MESAKVACKNYSIWSFEVQNLLLFIENLHFIKSRKKYYLAFIAFLVLGLWYIGTNNTRLTRILWGEKELLSCILLLRCLTHMKAHCVMTFQQSKMGNKETENWWGRLKKKSHPIKLCLLDKIATSMCRLSNHCVRLGWSPLGRNIWWNLCST